MRVRSYYQYLSTCQQLLKSYNQLNRFGTPHAENKLFLLIRQQATRGAVGYCLCRRSGALEEDDRWRFRLVMLVKKGKLL